MLYSGSPSVEKEDFSIYKPTIGFIDSWKPISAKESEIYKRLTYLLSSGRLVSLDKIFNVQQGIRTGNNQAFKITKSEYSQLDINEQMYFRPAIDNESIYCGIISDKNYIWYPYNENELTIKTEEELRRLCPQFYTNHFINKGYKEKLASRARKSIDDWWTLSEHRAWLRNKSSRLVSTEFGTSSFFAFDVEGFYVIERGYGWLPRKDFKDVDDNYFYLSIFTSPIFDRLLSIFSKQLAGGNWYDLGKKYVKNIPIPKISNDSQFNEDSSQISRISPIYVNLVRFGKLISENNFYENSYRDELIKEHIFPVF